MLIQGSVALKKLIVTIHADIIIDSMGILLDDRWI